MLSEIDYKKSLLITSNNK